MVGDGGGVLVGIGVALVTSVVGVEVTFSAKELPQAVTRMEDTRSKIQGCRKRGEHVLVKYQPNLFIWNHPQNFPSPFNQTQQHDEACKPSFESKTNLVYPKTHQTIG
jgi:hypothetical protein